MPALSLLKRQKITNGRRYHIRVQGPLRSKQRFRAQTQTNARFGELKAQHKQQNPTEHGKAHKGRKINRFAIMVTIVQKVELDGKENGQNRLQHFGDNAGVVEILKPNGARFGVAHDLGRRVESANDNVRGEAAETLHGGRSNQASVLVLFQRVFDLSARGQHGQFLAEDQGVLNGLAPALSQVGLCVFVGCFELKK